MKPRFSFFDNQADLFEHADKVEITLMDFDGALAIEFKISGGYAPELESDVTAGGASCQSKPDPANLAADIMARFVRAKGGAQ